MPSHPPIFKDHGTTYRADGCTPLEQAVERGDVYFKALARGHYPGDRLPRATLPGLKSVGFWDAVGPQEWGLDWHRNEGIELTFLETGALPFAVDGHAWPMRAGDLTFTRPWQSHRVGDPKVTAGRLFWVILDVGVRRPNQPWRWPSWMILSKEDLDRLTDLLRHNEQPVWPANTEISHCFQQIQRLLEGRFATGVQSRLAVCLNELFLALAETLHEQRIPLNPTLSSARRTVEMFLDDLGKNLEHLSLPWTVASMAEQCGLGVTAFTHYCRHVTNMTPMQFLATRRTERAAQLLVERPADPIIEIALACGFQSSQYFATVFRKQYGSTPRAYRQATEGK